MWVVTIGAEERGNISSYQILSVDKNSKSYPPWSKLAKKLAHVCASSDYPVKMGMEMAGSILAPALFVLKLPVALAKMPGKIAMQ